MCDVAEINKRKAGKKFTCCAVEQQYDRKAVTCIRSVPTSAGPSDAAVTERRRFQRLSTAQVENLLGYLCISSYFCIMKQSTEEDYYIESKRLREETIRMAEALKFEEIKNR